MSQVTKHFKLSEFVRSVHADKHHIDNSIPSDFIKENILTLCTCLLEPIRVYTGPIRIFSGYICPDLHTIVGDEYSAAHIQGLAVDIVFSHMSLSDALRLIIKHIAFDRLIVYYDCHGLISLRISYAHKLRNELIYVFRE